MTSWRYASPAVSISAEIARSATCRPQHKLEDRVESLASLQRRLADRLTCSKLIVSPSPTNAAWRKRSGRTLTKVRTTEPQLFVDQAERFVIAGAFRRP